jgi:hypothetical protein
LPLLLAVEPLLVLARRSRDQHADDDQREHEGDGSASPAGAREERPAPVLADEQPEHDRHQPQSGTAHQRVDHEVAEHLLDPGRGTLRLAGDQRVAVDQGVRARRVGLAELDGDADPAIRRHPDVGQHRTGEEHDVARQVRPDHGVVAGQSGLAAAVQEDRDRARQGDQRPGHDVRRADQDTAQPNAALGAGHCYPRACATA